MALQTSSETPPQPQLDENIVWAKMAALQAGIDAGEAWALTEREQILQRMLRYRDGRGIYAEGGCIDATREHLRWVCPETAQVQLPHLRQPHESFPMNHRTPQHHHGACEAEGNGNAPTNWVAPAFIHTTASSLITPASMLPI
jgi:hypothetical protein